MLYIKHIQAPNSLAAAVLGKAARQARLLCAASSATAELVGISIGLDLLLETEPLPERSALLCDSRVTLAAPKRRLALPAGAGNPGEDGATGRPRRSAPPAIGASPTSGWQVTSGRMGWSPGLARLFFYFLNFL